MYYEQQEQLGKLKLLLKNSISPHHAYSSNQQAENADVEWNASRFWAMAMYKSRPLNFLITYENFLLFKQKYEADNKIVIDDNNLFQKFWLRKILVYVKVSGAISLLSFNRIRPYKEELKFLLHLYLSKVSKNEINELEFIEEQRHYEATHKVTLSEDGLYSKGMASVKDGKVKLSNMDIYFKPYLDHWNDFEFLSALFADKEQGIAISANDLEELRNSFEIIYPKIPAIEIFEEQKIIKRSSDDYIINFYSDTVHIWTKLSDKISGLFWELLFNDTTYRNNEERIEAFLDKIFYWHGWPDFLSHCTNYAKHAFLNAALNLAINDNDLKDVEREIEKVQLDHRDHNPLGQNAYSNVEFRLRNSNLFELMSSLNNWQHKGHGDFLYHQGTREIIGFLIKSITCHDPDFKMIKVLLRSGIDRPYLLWQATRFIVLHRVESIPHLLIEQDLMTLAVILIDEIGVKTDATNYNELWRSSVVILLQNLSKNESDYPLTALKISQLYRQLNHNKYEIPYNRNNIKQKKHLRSERLRREADVLLLIENTPLYNGKIYGGNDMYLLPALHNHLARLFINLEEESFYRNGTVQFPMLKWDGMIWLMKCSTYWKYKAQVNKLLTHIDLISSFLTSYLGQIELTSVTKYDHFEKKEQNGIPYWSERLERLENIEWIYPIYFLDVDDKLNSFLNPNFPFEITDDQYHKANQFTADKLRTHIGVLLQILRKLVLPTIPYGFEKEKLNLIKSKIEKQIILYLNEVWREGSTKGNDIFEYNKEWGFNHSDKEALLPQIAQAINWFSNKDEITQIFTEITDIEKLLTLLDSITAEGIKKKLINRIKELDIGAILKTRWMPELKNILIRISHYPELIEQIEEVASYWEVQITNRRKENDYKIPLYNAKLLLGYFKKDIAAIESLEEPDNAIQSMSELSFHNYKEFYKALIIMDENPQESHRIFDDLCKQYPLYRTLAINRMAAKMRQAFKENNSLELHREALEEWALYESNFEDKDFELEEPTSSINKLVALYYIGEYTEMDKVFEKLDLPDRMLLHVLEVRTDALLAQKRVDEALIMLESAELYHQFSDLADATFINDLKSKVSGNDVLEVLQNQYSRIFNSKPERLIKILPEYLNGKSELHEFITQEVANSVSGMLDKIKSISEINNEDKYNDILELTLSSRMNLIGWQVHGQSRGAFSSPKGSEPKQPGERDLTIKSRNAIPLIVCEAFVYRGKTTAKSHLKKIFDYYHKRESFILIIYDTGTKGSDFQKNWKDYMQTIVPKTEFPLGYELIGKVEEIEKEFGYNNSAIKIGISKHTSNSILYHLFINIDYKIS